MKKLLIIIAFASFAFFSANAQNSGYSGRHLLVTYPVSATLFNQGTGIGLDYTLNRRFSFEALFQMGTKRVFTQPTKYYGYSEVFGSGTYVGSIENPRSRAHFRSLTLGLTYFLNSSLPAPLGNYIQVNVGNNIADFETFYHVIVFQDPHSEYERRTASIPSEINIYNMPFNSLSVSAGRRRVFYNNLSIDLRMSANFYQYMYRTPEQLTPIKNFGGNLAGYGLTLPAKNNYNTNFFTGQSVGLSFHILIGLLTL